MTGCRGDGYKCNEELRMRNYGPWSVEQSQTAAKPKMQGLQHLGLRAATLAADKG
jgi:hypothetical protein